MSIKDFIEKFAAQFYETEATEFLPETKFKELDEWSSMIALSVILMVDDEYKITINADDIENSTTIEQLYQSVLAKQ